MVLSLCLNPCVDHYVSYERTELGNIVRTYRSILAGKGINVAHSASALGMKSETMLLSPRTELPIVRNRFSALGIKSSFVEYDGEFRHNFKLIEQNGAVTEYNSKGFVAVAQEKIEEVYLKASAQHRIVVMSGSLPVGIGADCYKKLMEITPSNVKIILDTSGERMIEGLKARPYLIKPNLDEMEQALGITMTNYDAIKLGCEKLVSMGAAHVLASLGAEGAVISNGVKTYRAFCVKKVEAVNTVGAGDAMVATAAKLITQDAPIRDVLRYAVLGATRKVQSELPYLQDDSFLTDAAQLEDITIEEII